MEFDGKTYHFVPNTLTIKAGDVVNFHNVSGGPHNVAFWSDSIPAGAAAVLGANMPDQMQPLSGTMLVVQDAVYSISFAGAPVGDYKYYCLPHLAMGMKAILTVTE
jgi:plastocyanin